MSAKHTPGPWQINQFDAEQVCDADGENRGCGAIATLHGTRAEINANARLIAAAPELLAVLMKLRRGDLHQRVRPLFDEAQAAIAKAMGEPS
jgi:hypothetical protein